jgi:hypothetical protein
MYKNDLPLRLVGLRKVVNNLKPAGLEAEIQVRDFSKPNWKQFNDHYFLIHHFNLSHIFQCYVIFAWWNNLNLCTCSGSYTVSIERILKIYIFQKR